MQEQRLKERFKRLRKLMGWRWADVDQITGLTRTGSNVNKGLSPWTRLTVVVQERYERELWRCVLDAVNVRLGDWVFQQTDAGVFTFYGGLERSGPIELVFGGVGFSLTGEAGALGQLGTELKGIFPEVKRERQGSLLVVYYSLTAREESLEDYVATFGVLAQKGQ